MRRVTAAVSAAAFVIATAGVFAQAKPDFAGKWTREAPAAGAGEARGGGGGRGGGRGGGFGQEPTITQSGNTLTIEYTQGQNPVKLTYTIGGESKNTMAGRGGAQELTSKTAWEGNTLVITTALPNVGERKQVLSMEGGKLVVETTQPGRDGGPGTPTMHDPAGNPFIRSIRQAIADSGGDSEETTADTVHLESLTNAPRWYQARPRITKPGAIRGRPAPPA